MSSTAAASGFVFFLLSVQVIQSEDGWGVIYTPPHVCGEKKSTVEIHCNYTYPSRIQHRDIKTFWYIKLKNGEPVDLRNDSEYSGRVQYKCSEKFCNLIIKNLKHSDAAVYKFRIMTDHPKDKYTGFPGVTMTVSDPGIQVKVTKLPYNRVNLKCLSSCVLGFNPIHIWFKNGRNIKTGSSSYTISFGCTDVYACGVVGFEKQRSRAVYAPRIPYVMPRPYADLPEGSSVTLTCRSDSNPKAKCTWYKKRGYTNFRRHSESADLVFDSLDYLDAGDYYYKAENELGRIISESFTVAVAHAPQIPIVTAIPSADVLLGSSVTLTCYSDADPEANYTWYKRDEDSPKAKGQVFIIADFRAEHIGNYSCEAQNNRGRNSSTFQLTEGIPDPATTIIIYNILWNLLIVVPIALLFLYLWMRIKKTLGSTIELHEPIDGVELHRMSVYDDAAPIEDTKA